MEQVTVVGAGLAGCEATWQLVKRNIPVRLIEMRPKKESPAFHTGGWLLHWWTRLPVSFPRLPPAT